MRDLRRSRCGQAASIPAQTCRPPSQSRRRSASARSLRRCARPACQPKLAL